MSFVRPVQGTLSRFSADSTKNRAAFEATPVVDLSDAAGRQSVGFPRWETTSTAQPLSGQLRDPQQ
jgi:hypothetical protein